MGFASQLLAHRLEQTGENSQMTFGWKRAEVIGTMANVIASWLGAGWLIIAATLCILNGNDVEGGKMLVVSVLSFVLSFVQMLVLQSSSVQD